MSIASNQLDAFFACAKSGSFTQAAETLHITQSALSQRILNLENELQTALLIRDKAGIKLTSAGEELMRYCQNKEVLETEALYRIKGKDKAQLTGQIRIGGFSSVMRSVVLPALQPLLEKNSGLLLQFITKEMDELPKLLRRGEIDYLVLHYEWIKDDIETVKLGEEINALVEKQGYKGPDIYLDHDENDQTTSRYFKIKKDKRRLERRYLDDVYGLIDGVKLGLGRALIPLHFVQKEPAIRVVDPKTTLDYPVMLHFYRQPFYSQLHKAVVSALEKECPRLLKA